MVSIGCCAAEGISVTRVVAPSFVQRGRNATLRCEYNLGPCSLHSVTWSFNGTEFYSYVAEHGYGNPVANDDLPQVDRDKSTQDVVVLSKARLRDIGMYRCAVTSQGDEYYTDFKESMVMVGELPDEKPHIEPPPKAGTGPAGALKETYSPGDHVYLVCVSPPSYPAPTLTWTINKKKVTGPNLVPFNTHRNSEGLLTARLGLNTTLTSGHFKGGLVELECTSAVGKLRSNSLSRQLQDVTYTPDSPSGGDGSLVRTTGLSAVALFQLTVQLLLIIVVELLL